MNAEIEGYQEQLLSIKQDAPGIAGGLTDQQFNWRPAPNRWSIAECIDHLNVIAKAFMPAFDAAIADARARGAIGNGPFAYPLLERMFIALMEPPPRIRMRTTRPFAPAPERTAAAVMREFAVWQDEMALRLRNADGLDLRRARMRSPVLRRLSYSLGTGFVGFLAHERRHVWQARRVRNELDGTGAIG